jgi:hypothetical protein
MPDLGMENVEIFYNDLEYFTAIWYTIWYNLWSFGVVYGRLV